MKPNIHPELYRAMQTAREEDISASPRGIARGAIPTGARGSRGAGERRRSSNVRSEMHRDPAETGRRANEHPCARSSTRRQPSDPQVAC